MPYTQKLQRETTAKGKGDTDYLCLQNKSKEAIAYKEPLRIIRNIAAEKVEYESLRFLECTMLT